MTLLKKKERTKMFEEMTGEKSHETVPVKKKEDSEEVKKIRKVGRDEINAIMAKLEELDGHIKLLIKKDEGVHQTLEQK